MINRLKQWWLKRRLKGHIQFALSDAAKIYNCKVDELEYKVSGNGAINVRKKK